MKIEIDTKDYNSEITSLKPGETFLYKNSQRYYGFDVYMIISTVDCHKKQIVDIKNFSVAAVNLNTGKIGLFGSACAIIPIKLKVVKED